MLSAQGHEPQGGMGQCVTTHLGEQQLLLHSPKLFKARKQFGVWGWEGEAMTNHRIKKTPNAFLFLFFLSFSVWKILSMHEK